MGDVQAPMEPVGDFKVNGQQVFLANERFVKPGIYVYDLETCKNVCLVEFDSPQNPGPE